MRKLVPILSFVFLLTAPFWLVLGFFSWQKQEIRETLKRQLLTSVNASELVQFTFASRDTATLPRWEHAWEFEYQGQMYDIVEQRAQQDSNSLYLFLGSG